MTDLPFSMTPILHMVSDMVMIVSHNMHDNHKLESCHSMRTSNSMTFPWLFGKFSYSKTFPWLSMTAIFPGFSMTMGTLCICDTANGPICDITIVPICDITNVPVTSLMVLSMISLMVLPVTSWSCLWHQLRKSTDTSLYSAHYYTDATRCRLLVLEPGHTQLGSQL